MLDQFVAVSAQPLITYTRSWDARTFVVRASLTPAERGKLQSILDHLAVLGTVVLARADNEASVSSGMAAVIDGLRRSLGRLTVDAAVAAAEWPASPFVPPQAVIPLWEFEPAEGTADVLVADGLLLGAHLMVEALRVEDDEEPVPVAECRDCWQRDFSCEPDLGTVRIPGGSGAYAVRAVVKAG